MAQNTSETSALSSAEDGGPRRWQVTSEVLQVFASHAADAEIIGNLDEGDILRNLGCVEAAEVVWCEAQSLGIRGSGYVDAKGLAPARGPRGDIALGVDGSKKRARKRDFDESFVVPCSQEQGQAFGTCQAAVARSGGGDATVVVTFSNGFARQLYFTLGDFFSASATMSGAGKDTDWAVVSDRYTIRVDDQRYEIPLKMILGD